MPDAPARARSEGRPVGAVEGRREAGPKPGPSRSGDARILAGAAAPIGRAAVRWHRAPPPARPAPPFGPRWTAARAYRRSGRGAAPARTAPPRRRTGSDARARAASRPATAGGRSGGTLARALAPAGRRWAAT